MNEFGKLTRVALRDPAAAFRSEAKIAAEWRGLNYHQPPDYAASLKEYDALTSMITASGAEIIKLPADESLTLDAIYTRDSLVVARRAQNPGGLAARSPRSRESRTAPACRRTRQARRRRKGSAQTAGRHPARDTG